MKIDLNSIDRENFNVKEGLIAGETCYLVTPKLLSTPWTKDNIVFRSSIWNKDGELVSASFPKFTNWGEREDLFPLPKSLENTTAVTKIDGSALIVSFYKGQLITRTRGTFDVSSLENGHEINLLKEKYPKVFDFGDKETHNESFIYEWTTPTQKICLDYGKEPQLHLIGIIKHEDYSLYPQFVLNTVANLIRVNRPKSHMFKDIPDMISTIKKWQGLEGVCLYFNNDQDILKIKADSYLLLHHFKSNATLNNVLDLFFEYDCPNKEDFKKKLIEKFDYECWGMVENLVKQICELYLLVKVQSVKFELFVNNNKDLDQKSFAIKNLTENKENASFCFELRSKNDLSKKSLRKLMERELKI